MITRSLSVISPSVPELTFGCPFLPCEGIFPPYVPPCFPPLGLFTFRVWTDFLDQQDFFLLELYLLNLRLRSKCPISELMDEVFSFGETRGKIYRKESKLNLETIPSADRADTESMPRKRVIGKVNGGARSLIRPSRRSRSRSWRGFRFRSLDRMGHASALLSPVPSGSIFQPLTAVRCMSKEVLFLVVNKAGFTLQFSFPSFKGN